jgi:chromosomal replication initiation ATPase DnaA
LSARATVRDVMVATCCVFRVTFADLKSHRRCPCCARVRHMAIGLARELTDASYPVIAREFGYKDHTGAIAAVSADAAREDAAWHSDRKLVIAAIPAAVAARGARMKVNYENNPLHPGL